VTVRWLLTLLLACLAVFGCSFGAARLASDDEEPARARSLPPPPTRTAQPSSQRLALDSAPGLPGLRARPRPKPEPAVPAAPAAPAAPAVESAPAPTTVSVPTQPAPAPEPVVPQEPAPSAGETTTFYDGG
jgi:translation initiation factor IF-2